MPMPAKGAKEASSVTMRFMLSVPQRRMDRLPWKPVMR